VSAGVLNAAPSARGTNRTVALTFDDGPGRSTQAIINILRSFHVRATFFNIGWDISDYPSLVKEEASDGFLLGDHTNSHPDMADLSSAAQTSEIDQVAALQRRLTGTVPCIFRPPYGDYNAATLSIANIHGMSLWMWSASGDDWEAEGSASSYWIHHIENSVIDSSIGQLHPVVLLHNQMIAMPATVAALPVIIRSFERRGYTFVDLLGRSGPPGVCGNAATSVSTFTPTSTILSDGTTLASGEATTSPNGQFVLTMNGDGQLTYSEVDGPTLWSTPTSGSPGAVANVTNGALTITGADGATLWSTNASGRSADLDLESNGSLALVSGASTLWKSNSTLTTMRSGSLLKPGWYVSSPNSRCQLVMEPTGALKLAAGDQTLWSNIAKAPNGRTVMQPSGSVVTLNAAGNVVWSSATRGQRNDFLSVTNAGTLTLSDPHRPVFWATQ
jgi:peptidoglycan/xylan/chitin deacetylase (PgdA/CDA1 family)